MTERSFIVEIRRLGNAARAAAVDVATGLEVTIVGAAASPDAVLEKAAVRKLEAALAAAGKSRNSARPAALREL